MKKLVHFLIKEIQAIFSSAKSSYHAAPPEMQKGAKKILGGALALVVLFIVWNFGSTYYQQRQMEEELRKGPPVKTARATMAPAERVVKVTGEARPFAAVTLYAKVSGYLKEVKVDKGDVVKKGQMLAIIESPETDKAYQAALADAKNKKAIAQRIAKLLEKDLVSQQEADTAKSDADVAAAHLESQEVLKSYEILRAPFDGTVTSRFADPGALMQNATASQTSALPVLAISQVKELRVYVYLDQRDALYVGKGTPATVSLTERPDLILQGHVERVSGELDEKTRMLLAEIDLDNKDRSIVAGSLVEVTLNLKTIPGVEVPSEALVLRDGKTVVPVVNENDEVTYTEVKVADNNGKTIKIQSGLQEGQIVALNLGNTVADHGKVRPSRDPAPKATVGTTTSPTKAAGAKE
jgi:RND family efflux transporter MFP subunit